MALDRSAVGITDEPVTMPIERGKIREFAKATRSANPAYVDDRKPVIPPTFLTTLNFWTVSGSSALSKLDVPLERVLHGGQEYVFHGPPPRAGTELTAQTRVDDVFEKEGKRGGTMTFIVMVTELRDPQGTLVAEAKSTVIVTGKAPTAGEGS